MKLSAREAAAFAARPDTGLCGVLFYGEDGAEVARRRALAAKSIVGDGGDADLSVKRLSAADARKNPAEALDAVKAQGFFGGRQVLVVEDAGDGVAAICADILGSATPEDAFLVVTAGVLPARSKLRKVFETAKNAAAAPSYLDAMGQTEIAEELRALGVAEISDDALRDLAMLARGLDRAAMRDVTTRLSLFALDIGRPVDADDVHACAPVDRDGEIDQILDAVADGRADELGDLMARMAAQGATATGMAIAACRYFRRIHVVLTAEARGGSVDAAVKGLRPPVFGAARDGLVRRCRRWRLPAVEAAISLLTETDATLRSGGRVVEYALLERAFLKLALTARRM